MQKTKIKIFQNNNYLVTAKLKCDSETRKKYTKNNLFNTTSGGRLKIGVNISDQWQRDIKRRFANHGYVSIKVLRAAQYAKK